MKILQQQSHPLSCAAPHHRWPENAHLKCYLRVHGTPHHVRLQRTFAAGARVRVAGRYVAGGFTQSYRVSGELGSVVAQVGTRVSVALDARAYENDVEDFTAAALDLVPDAV